MLTQLGGSGGGGAALSGFGRAVVDNYRAMEDEVAAVVARRLEMLEGALASGQGRSEGPDQPGN